MNLNNAALIIPETLQGELAAELEDNILAYWLEHALDREQGGFYGLIENDNTVHAHAPKGLVMHARFLWSYSAACRMLKQQRYRQAAEHALLFLNGKLRDNQYGGYYWIVSADGKPLQKRKYVYGQAFAVYGLSEYFRAGGADKAGEQAMELFDLLEEHARDRESGGYYEALEQDWSPIEGGKASLGEEDPVCVKSMNTNLHVLEAYTNLYRITKSNKVKEALESLIICTFDHIVDNRTNHLILFFDREWNRSQEIHSYGHDIEASWLLWEALHELGDSGLKEKYRGRIISMADTVLAEGLGDDYGLNNELSGGRLDSDRHWWPQAEMMIGLFNAWQMTGEKKYLDPVPRVWDYIKKNIVADNGEWYWGRKQDGSQIRNEKGGIWKTPYHNSRCCMELIERIGDLSGKENGK